jgi:hypothetical protein
MKWWRSRIALLAIGLVFFLATAAGQRSLLPWPEGGGLRAKVLTYLDHQDSFDAIYLGSSYTAHGIDPLIVDPIVSQQLGRPFSSFNLAVNAAHRFETDHLIRTLLEDPPERLRFVVIEAQESSAILVWFERLVTERSIYWHTPRFTSLALLDLADSRRAAAVRGEDAMLHLRMFARHMTNAGFGFALVASLTGAEPPSLRRDSANVLRAQGYSEMGRMEDGSIAPSRQRLLDHPKGYLKRRDQFESRPRSVDSMRVALATLEAEVAFLEARGLVPIYVMPPLLRPPEGYEEFARRGVISDFLSYASPARHPDLFQLASRWDEQHLSRRGAKRWSARLGHDLAPIILDRQTR